MKKTSKAWFAIPKLLFKSKKKTLDTYLHLIETIIKPIALYACESWDDYDKKGIVKIEQFHVSLCKQVLEVRKTTSNIQVLAEVGRLPFKIYIETQMFKYLQSLHFLEENSYLRKVLNE